MTSNSKWISSAVVAVALLVAAASAECDCGSSHPYVGFSAHLINRVGSDSPAGVVTILDDCHVAISDFYFNAEPPLTRVWGATNVSDINGTGFELHPTVLDTPLDGAYLVFRLPVDVDFDDFSVLSIWCVSVAVDLASVALGPGCASTHARVGAMYSLAGVHGIHGVVSVLDDCRIQISEFRYDGEAPDAWVWSGELGGWPISTGPMRAKDGVDMILPLPAGYDLDDLNTVSIWCRAMNATLALTEVIENKCAATHPLVGAIGSLTPLAHEVSGLVEVVDDCTAVVHDLTYDGLAPFTYLWLGPTVATMASGGRGFNTSLTSEVDGDTFVLHLPAGTSWDDWQAASVWCEGGAGMDLGSTTVRKCGSTSDRVGFTASFPLSAAHDIRGVFTITDDCHAHITGWTFDGAPPDTYIFAASAGALADGDNISGPVKLGAADDDQLLLTLPVGAAWDDYDTISAWCVEVSSDLGSFGLENFCGASHAKVGGSASIRASPIIHDIRGVVTVIDDCTFRVDGLGFDATAPETFWWGSTSADLTAGGRVADDQLILAIEDETVVVRLSTGTDWDDIDYLSVYCESASMDMGSGMLPEPAACSANHPFVGFRGELTLGGNPGEHGVRGKVEVVDDCTILVTEYYYDGAAPRVLFWGADSAANVNGGIELSAPQDDVQSSETFVVRLPTGTTLDDVAYFTSWCSLMNVTMAAVQLGPGVCEDYRPAEASDPRDAFDNCITLLDGKYNVYWTLSGAGSVVYAVEAAVRDDEWIGFGWSENPAVTQMPGADVVIAGFDDGLPYVIDHKLYARSQCDYSGANTGGVCPDAGAGFSDDATLLYAEVVDGVTFIVFEKALNTSDTDADVAVDPTVEHAAVWAIGPRNADTDGVVILRHLSENRATFGAGNGIRLADTGNTCTAPVVPLPPPTVDVSTPRATVDGASVTTLNFTIGSNPRYPNPPGWGLAFWINGEETPDLTLVRGVEYTFNVAGGPTHPLYITDDIIGGRSDGSETVYAGQSGAWEGTPSAPYTATWTPPADTPDLLYYQCWEHQRLGWEITFVNCGNGVVDEGEECDGGDGCEHDCTATPVDDDGSDDAGGINAGAAASASDDGPSIPILIGVLVPLGVIVLAMVLCAVFMLCIHKGDKGAGQGKAASGKGAKLAPVVGKSTAAKASSAGSSSAQAATSGKGKKAGKVSAASGSASDTSGSASASGSYYSS